jgi:hypothetical protein
VIVLKIIITIFQPEKDFPVILKTLILVSAECRALRNCASKYEALVAEMKNARAVQKVKQVRPFELRART